MSFIVSCECRALKKAEKLQSVKSQAHEVIVQEITKTNEQIKDLGNRIELRLKEYVNEKNRLAKEANSVIDESETLYGELEIMCKNANVPIEEILTENAKVY